MSNPLPYFKPDERQSLVLGNFDYSKIRWTEQDADGNEIVKGYQDLLEVRDDIDEFYNEIVKYGFDETDITKMDNISQA